MNQYVLTDRVTSIKYAITISDAQFIFTPTGLATNPDLVIQDGTRFQNRWKLFISDGQIGFEPTTDVVISPLDLVDSYSGLTYRIVINDSQLGLFDTRPVLIIDIPNNQGYFDIKMNDMDFLNQTLTVY